MKTNRITALLTLASSLALSAGAQIAPPLPAGINTFATPVYAANVPSFLADLGDLYFDSDLTVPSATINAWNNGPVNLAAAFGSNPFLALGGSVKVVFLGETAGWKNDFGYVNTTTPTAYNPLVTDIENNFVSGGPSANIRSGWETTVSYGAGQQLDFFLNGEGVNNPGGTWFAFGGANQNAGADVSVHTKWSTRSVTTTYFDGVSVVTGEINTLLVGFEDVRLGGSYYDNDFNDFVVGFQFLPTQPNPVPEPSTYGLLGAAALAGLVVRRRMAAKKA